MQRKRFLFLVLFIALTALAAQAQVFDFTLVNKTGMDIDEVYVAPADDDEWGEDILGIDVLEDKKSVEIEIDEDYEEVLLDFEVDLYDLKVVDEDGEEHVWSDLKLEAITSIELSFDKKGNAIAKVK